MKVSDIYTLIDGIAPFDTAEAFDNVGLLVGDPEAEVTKIGVALDLTNELIDRAAAEGVDLIVTHHPAIFNPVKKLCATDPVYRLIRAGISYLAAHTNLDKAESGVNAVLAGCYRLQNVASPLSLNDLGRIGELAAPMSVPEYAAIIRQELNADAVRYYDSGKPVQTVAYIAGSGGSELETVLGMGADTFITGDLKHDRFVAAQNYGINLIEANHCDAERQVLKPFCGQLSALCGTIPVVLLEEENKIRCALR